MSENISDLDAARKRRKEEELRIQKMHQNLAGLCCDFIIQFENMGGTDFEFIAESFLGRYRLQMAFTPKPPTSTPPEKKGA